MTNLPSGAVLVPEVGPGRPAPGDGAVAALQLEEHRDHLVRLGVEVEDGGAATQELQKEGGIANKLVKGCASRKFRSRNLLSHF